MPSKRQHSKSRRGCGQCKQRRIKCDEIVPCCGSCSKKGIECDYQSLKDVQNSIYILTQASFTTRPRRSTSRSSGSPGKSSTFSPSSPGSGVITPSGFSAEEMLLMHHFSLYTARTIGIVDSYHDIWQTRVPSIACQHPFLMHAVLSFTAAHRSDSKLSRFYYGRAIAEFTTSDCPLTPEKTDAVFCYCVLIMLITFVLECCQSASDSPIGGLYEFFGALRSAIKMLSSLQVDFKKGEMAGLMCHLAVLPTPKALPEAVSLSLDRLDNLIGEEPSFDLGTLVALRDATFHLRRFFTIMDPRPKSWAYILRWVVGLSPEYLNLLQQDNPAALAVLSHWLVPMHHAPQRWYVGDWPKRVILAISQKLANTVWLEGVIWALAETNQEAYCCEKKDFVCPTEYISV